MKRGDTLAVTFALNELFTIVAEDIPLDIIYEDEVRFPFHDSSLTYPSAFISFHVFSLRNLLSLRFPKSPVVPPPSPLAPRT